MVRFLSTTIYKPLFIMGIVAGIAFAFALVEMWVGAAITSFIAGLICVGMFLLFRKSPNSEDREIAVYVSPLAAIFLFVLTGLAAFSAV